MLKKCLQYDFFFLHFIHPLIIQLCNRSQKLFGEKIEGYGPTGVLYNITPELHVRLILPKFLS
jgi:hypothetical protein